VPAIVPRQLFETVHERLRLHEERYCRPVTHYLLQGLVQCGVCGSRCSSSRRYHKVLRPSGKLSVYHRAVYRCNRRARENMHDRTRIERCRNSEIGTHILEGKVFELIRAIMLDPGKLRRCIDTGGRLDDRSIARELARIAGEIRALDEERRRLIRRYASEQIAGEAYITANRAWAGTSSGLPARKPNSLRRCDLRSMRISWTRASGSSAPARGRASRSARTSIRSGSFSSVTSRE
jgi:hypothetical protein